MRRIAVIAAAAAIFVSSAVVGQEPLDPLVEACAVWTFLEEEPPTTLTTYSRVHRHVFIWLQQGDTAVNLTCDFLDGEAKIPELIGIAIDGTQMDSGYLADFNRLVWDHFIAKQ